MPVTSAKRKIFIAGADIHEIENLTNWAKRVEITEGGKAIFRRLEGLKVPTNAGKIGLPEV